MSFEVAKRGEREILPLAFVYDLTVMDSIFHIAPLDHIQED
jgi:hypothetical protein